MAGLTRVAGVRVRLGTIFGPAWTPTPQSLFDASFRALIIAFGSTFVGLSLAHAPRALPRTPVPLETGMGMERLGPINLDTLMTPNVNRTFH